MLGNSSSMQCNKNFGKILILDDLVAVSKKNIKSMFVSKMATIRKYPKFGKIYFFIFCTGRGEDLQDYVQNGHQPSKTPKILEIL